MNEFVAIELLHLLVKKTEKGYQLGKKIFSNNYPFLTILFDYTNIQTLNNLLEILHHYGHSTSIGGRDSSIILSMEKNNIQNIVTNDGGFNYVDNITVINPVKL
jgi:predicted nucleic acid-binding protein